MADMTDLEVVTERCASSSLAARTKLLSGKGGLTMQKWISVKDRMPDPDDEKDVVILVKETEHYGQHKEKTKVYWFTYLAYWDGDEWYTVWCNGCKKISETAAEPYADEYEVTHWMPLPEPPKGV